MTKSRNDGTAAKRLSSVPPKSRPRANKVQRALTAASKVEGDESQAEALLEVMAERRTRRFPKGADMPPEGPLAFRGESTGYGQVTELQQATLAFAGVGLTGPVLGDVPYQSDPKGGGNVLASLVGRSALSPDAAHCVSLVVVNDSGDSDTAGVHFLRRPQNFKREDLIRVASYSAERTPDWQLRLYEELRVKLPNLSRETLKTDLEAHKPPMPTFNTWASNAKGSTYFLPVLELSEIYLSILFGGLEENSGYFIVDDRNGLLPAGLANEARSRGGYLNDKPSERRIFTQDYIETLASMLAAIELGAVMQNLSLMAHALGLGGWPHFAGGTAWLKALRFKNETLKSSRVLGLPDALALELRLAGQDQDVWSPLGLAAPDGGDPLIKPYCPPFYSNMKEAVLAFVEAKFEKERGRFRADGNPSRWKDDPSADEVRKAPNSRSIRKGIPPYSPQQIQAAVDHASYVYDRYGRFPGKFGPLTTVTAFQVHQLEEPFYQKYYRPSALNATAERSKP